MADTIGFDPVAWSIDGGRHNGELLRVLAYAATGGAEGTVSPGDCKVHQLATPGGQVVIDAGAVLIRNRSANVRNQTYAANGRVETRLDIRPTGAAARSDLVVIRVEDPQYAPWPAVAPADAPTYQYVRPVIIEGVASNTLSFYGLNLGQSGYALARIDIPANTSVITDAMIKNLRYLAQPRSERWMYSNNAGANPTTLGNSSWETFPWVNNGLIVPSWATFAEMRVNISGLIQTAALATAELRGHIGDDIISGPSYLDADTFWDGVTHSTIITCSGAIPTAYLGQIITVQVQGRVIDPSGHPGRFRADRRTHVGYDVQFYERTV